MIVGMRFAYPNLRLLRATVGCALRTERWRAMFTLPITFLGRDHLDGDFLELSRANHVTGGTARDSDSACGGAGAGPASTSHFFTTFTAMSENVNAPILDRAAEPHQVFWDPGRITLPAPAERCPCDEAVSQRATIGTSRTTGTNVMTLRNMRPNQTLPRRRPQA